MGGCLVMTAAVGVFLPALSPASNCGGNSAAKSRCSSLGTTLQLFLADHSDGFDAAKHGWVELKIQPTEFQGWGTTAENFFVRRKVDGFPGGTTVVAVCDREFSNVPQPTFWNGFRKTPGHAALLSDGTTKVISPAQFASLDLTNFVSVKSLPGGDKVASTK